MSDDDLCHHQHPAGPPGRIIMSHPMSEPCLLRETALRAQLVEAQRNAERERDNLSALVAALRAALLEARNALLDYAHVYDDNDAGTDASLAHEALSDSLSAATDYERSVRERVKEECAKVADRWASSHSCNQHDADPCCHVRTGVGIAVAIRNLP